MEFIDSPPDVIRSDSQRWLLDHWNRMRADAPLPTWQCLETDELAARSADLSFTDVVLENGNVRFRIRFHGERIAVLYGLGNCTGKFLDDCLPESYRKAALGTYRQAVATGLPVYTVADMRDGAGRIVHYERLLLPVGRNGTEADGIAASLETVSPEGAFESRDLMKAPPRPPAFALCATIQF
jgi:hypothetical protein